MCDTLNIEREDTPMTNTTKHILQGRDAEGNSVYYTGKAGQSFVSAKSEEAFGYDSLEAARRRATNLNQMTSIHGFRFMVPVGE